MGKRKLVWLGSHEQRIVHELAGGYASDDVSGWTYFGMLDHKYEIDLTDRQLDALNKLELLAKKAIPGYVAVASVEDGYGVMGPVKDFYLRELEKVRVSGEYGLESNTVEKLMDAVKESGPVKIRQELKNKYL